MPPDWLITELSTVRKNTMNRQKRTCIMEADLFTVFFFLMFKNIESICWYTSIHGDSQEENYG